MRSLVLAMGLLWGAQSLADHSITLGAGYGYSNTKRLNSHVLEYSYNNRWILGIKRMGGVGFDNTTGFYAAHKWTFRQGRRFQPFLQLGVGYTQDLIPDPYDNAAIAFSWTDNPIILDPGNEPIVSDRWTHHIYGGVRWRQFSVGIMHESTGGQSARNQGIDQVVFSVNIKLGAK